MKPFLKFRPIPDFWDFTGMFERKYIFFRNIRDNEYLICDFDFRVINTQKPHLHAHLTYNLRYVTQSSRTSNLEKFGK